MTAFNVLHIIFHVFAGFLIVIFYR